MKKQIRVLISALLLFVPFVSYSQLPKLRSADALQTKTDLTAKKMIGTLKPGYHFNDKAPNGVVVDGKDQKMILLKPQSVEFALPAKWSEGQASLYVCDDAVTYCETHSIVLKGPEAVKAKTTETSKVIQVKATSSKPGKWGFIEDDLEQALKLATESKKPVLVDFSARWCPGCVRYEKEIFPKEQFAKITRGFVKVKIDVDLFKNSSLSQKYKIQGIPTFVIMSAQGEEISRLVDFRPMEGLSEFLANVEKDPTPMSLLAANSDASSEQTLTLGRRLLASGQPEASIPHFEKVKPSPPELLQARIETAKAAVKSAASGDQKANTTAKDGYIKALRAAIDSEKESTRSIAWRTELISELPPKSQEISALLQAGTAVANRCLAEPDFLNAATKTESLGEFTGYEKLWVALLRADLYEAAAAPPDEITKAWEQAASIGAAYKVSAKKSGPALRYLIVLGAAKKFADGEKFANEILKHDPSNTDVKRRKMKLLLGQNKNTEAVKLGEKILPIAEGRNEFWIAESLAKAYIADKKPVEAKRLLTAYIARPELQTEMMKSSKKSFEELLKSLN